jgi:hypothetical protein
MSILLSLVAPIVLSAILIFVLSSIIHMATPWHHADYGKVPNEQGVMDALRPLAPPPGDYLMPRPDSMNEMRNPEFIARRKAGPVMVFTVLPNGMPGIGKNLINWFLYCLAIGFVTAYVAASTLPAGTAYPKVFQVVATVSFLGYAGALWQASIWMGRSWGTTLRSTIDGFLYGLLTAGTFGWLWPAQ